MIASICVAVVKKNCRNRILLELLKKQDVSANSQGVCNSDEDLICLLTLALAVAKHKNL